MIDTEAWPSSVRSYTHVHVIYCLTEHSCSTCDWLAAVHCSVAGPLMDQVQRTLSTTHFADLQRRRRPSIAVDLIVFGTRWGDLWLPTAVVALCAPFQKNPLLGQAWHGEENLRPRSKYYIYTVSTCLHFPPAVLLSNKKLFFPAFLSLFLMVLVRDGLTLHHNKRTKHKTEPMNGQMFSFLNKLDLLSISFLTLCGNPAGDEETSILFYSVVLVAFDIV